VADPARGLVYGNRGCLHDDAGRIRRRYSGKRWIACRLEFRGWQRQRLLQPGRFTELFFLGEAAAVAGRHRPCALCRREDYVRFLGLWESIHSLRAGADAVDERLHMERLADDRRQRHHDAPAPSVPDGTFVLHAGDPWIVIGSTLRRWTPAGYVGSLPRPDGVASVVTPPSLVEVLRRGWSGSVPLLHPSVR